MPQKANASPLFIAGSLVNDIGSVRGNFRQEQKCQSETRLSHVKCIRLGKAQPMGLDLIGASTR